MPTYIPWKPYISPIFLLDVPFDPAGFPKAVLCALVFYLDMVAEKAKGRR